MRQSVCSPDYGLSGMELHYLSRSGSKHPTEAAGSEDEDTSTERDVQTGPDRCPCPVQVLV